MTTLTEAVLTKAVLTDRLASKLGFNKRESMDIVETFLEEIKLSLENGEQVKLAGYGNFRLIDKKQRIGRNLTTGEEVPISERRVVVFSAGEKLNNKVESYVKSDLE